jgi:DinB superfamily
VVKRVVPKDLSLLLQGTIELELPHLLAITEEAAGKTDGRPGSWSRKQELGHLIDSATNNHIRFVLATVDGEFRGLGYAQDKWVEAHGYGDMAWRDLVDLWYRYNGLLAHLIERIPEQHVNNRCVIGWGVLTLGFVIEDYVLHLQHHIDHVLARDPVTRYPAAAAGV